MKREVSVLLTVFIISILVGFHLRWKELPEMKVVKEIQGNLTIGVLSDTHIPSRAKEIPDELLQRFREEKVDLIIHGGDLISLSVKEELESIAPVVAVCGNMDPKDVCGKLPKSAIVEVNDFRIGVIHNTVNPLSNKMARLAKENNLDLIIFGHTHRNSLEKKEGVYYLNPGSPTQPIMDSKSYALVKITQDEIKPKLVNYPT